MKKGFAFLGGVFLALFCTQIYQYTKKEDGYYVPKMTLEKCLSVISQQNEEIIEQYSLDSRVASYGYLVNDNYGEAVSSIISLLYYEMYRDTVNCQLPSMDRYVSFIKNTYTEEHKGWRNFSNVYIDSFKCGEDSLMNALNRAICVSSLLKYFDPRDRSQKPHNSFGEIIIPQEDNKIYEIPIQDTLFLKFRVLYNHLLGKDRFEILENEFPIKKIDKDVAIISLYRRPNHMKGVIYKENFEIKFLDRGIVNGLVFIKDLTIKYKFY